MSLPECAPTETPERAYENNTEPGLNWGNFTGQRGAYCDCRETDGELNGSIPRSVQHLTSLHIPVGFREFCICPKQKEQQKETSKQKKKNTTIV